MKRMVLFGLAVLLAAVASASASSRGTSGGCTNVKRPKLGPRSGPKTYPKLNPAKTNDVVITTNCGSFTIKLAARISPHTTASFASLVRRGYFDRTIFHRIVPGFVIQGGDPTGTGEGGPGYTTVDRPPASTQYTLGLVAMAKTQTEPAGTSGSQFFVVTGGNVGLSLNFMVASMPTPRLGGSKSTSPRLRPTLVRSSLSSLLSIGQLSPGARD